MFIKFGKEEHLKSLMEKGEIFFNPCIKFRNWEKDDGIKDTQDGGIKIKAMETKISNSCGVTQKVKNIALGFIIEPAKNIPVFCLFQIENIQELNEQKREIEKQFPDYSHALIIEDEEDFLENIRFSFRNKAFCHKIFYQDMFYEDFLEFLYKGKSDVLFYSPQKKKDRLYAYIKYEPIDGSIRQLDIDDSNFYKTMYTKRTNYIAQREYRIVLPYEQIDKGKIFNIQPFNAMLVKIEELCKG